MLSGGRLPLTWYETGYVDMLPMTSMPLRPVDSLGYPGRTYKFFNGPTVYPFGYGLSYTKFKYQLTSSLETLLKIKLNKHQHCHNLNYTNEGYRQYCPVVRVDDLRCDHYQFGFEATIQNLGNKDGGEVVIVYSKPPEGIVGTHAKKVIGFERIFVPAGGSKMMKLKFNACKSLAIVDSTGYSILPSGVHTIMVGDGAAAVSFFVKVSFGHGLAFL